MVNITKHLKKKKSLLQFPKSQSDVIKCLVVQPAAEKPQNIQFTTMMTRKAANVHI